MPIAVGCTLRRLVAKIVSQVVVKDMAALLSPRQLSLECVVEPRLQFMRLGSTCRRSQGVCEARLQEYFQFRWS